MLYQSDVYCSLTVNVNISNSFQSDIIDNISDVKSSHYRDKFRGEIPSKPGQYHDAIHVFLQLFLWQNIHTPENYML